MRRTGSFLAGALVCLVAVPALAVDAGVSVTHAINGEDLGLSEALPVDIAVDGTCIDALESLEFGETRGPIPLPAPATYNVEVYLDLGGAACSGALVIDTDVSVLFGQAVNIVAHLNESGQPKATAFNSNLTDTGGGQTRVAVHHTASAPTVDVILRRTSDDRYSRFIGRYFRYANLDDLSNSDQAVADLPAAEWSVRLRDAVSRKTVFGPVLLTLDPRTLYSVLAVGTAGTETFDVKIIATPTD